MAEGVGGTDYLALIIISGGGVIAVGIVTIG
jgi:hypothetical protein